MEEEEIIAGLRAELTAAYPAMDTRLRNALAERGHGAAAVERLTPEERFREFCDWEGLLGWSGTLLTVAKSAGVVL